MRKNLIATVLSVLLACRLAASDSVNSEILAFKASNAKEGYIVIIGSAIAARFEVAGDAEEEYLTRVVTVSGVDGTVERLSKEHSKMFLRKFRSFDWNTKPGNTKSKKIDPAGDIGCVVPDTTVRITFMARFEDTSREIEGGGTLIPSLADLLEVVVSKAKEANQSATAQRP